MIKKYPFYIKSTVVIFGLILLFYSLNVLQETLVPLAFALLLSVLLNPFVIKLGKWHFPKILAIATAIIISLIVIAAIFYLITKEIAGFTDQLPLFKKKLMDMWLHLQHQVGSYFGINRKQQAQYIDEAGKGLKPIIGTAAGGLMGVIGMLVLMPVYTFLFLFYKPLLLNFLYEVFADADEKEVGVVLTQTKGAIQSYMFGLVLEAIAVAIMNITALFILGVDYAILLGVLGALLNVLPFIGGIIAVVLPVLIATVTKDGYKTQLLIIAAYGVIQFIDNHFLVPYLVASKVKINALISILIVFLGGQLWGISGMFLSIPFIGVLKIIFDRLPELKPWGKLLGDEIPTRNQTNMWNRGSKKISKIVKMK
jgi:predicted PurR-regulated permease PerM